MSTSASIANLRHRARAPWILEDPCHSWLWNVPKKPVFLRPSLARPGPWEVVAVLQDSNRSILKTHHHAQRLILRVTTMGNPPKDIGMGVADLARIVNQTL